MSSIFTDWSRDTIAIMGLVLAIVQTIVSLVALRSPQRTAQETTGSPVVVARRGLGVLDKLRDELGAPLRYVALSVALGVVVPPLVIALVAEHAVVPVPPATASSEGGLLWEFAFVFSFCHAVLLACIGLGIAGILLDMCDIDMCDIDDSPWTVLGGLGYTLLGGGLALSSMISASEHAADRVQRVVYGYSFGAVLVCGALFIVLLLWLVAMLFDALD